MINTDLDNTNFNKWCRNCGKPIPFTKIDTLGRTTTKTSDYCSNNNYCRNKYLTTHTHPGYFQKYYQNNKDKYNAKSTKSSR